MLKKKDKHPYPQTLKTIAGERCFFQHISVLFTLDLDDVNNGGMESHSLSCLSDRSMIVSTPWN